MKKTHTHHIIPRHMGGTDHEDNLVELSVADHAEAHRVLFEEHGKLEDKLAWLSLSKQITVPEFKKMLASIAGQANKGSKAWYNPETGQSIKSKTKPESGTWLKGRGNSFVTKIDQHHHDASGTMWCHNPTNITETKMVEHEGLIPAGWIKGRHHSNVHNSKGFKWYHNSVTGERRTSKDNPGGDWVQGLPQDLLEKRVFTKGNDYSRNRKGSSWFHNPENPSQTKMIKESEAVPSNWIKGRAPRKPT